MKDISSELIATAREPWTAMGDNSAELAHVLAAAYRADVDWEWGESWASVIGSDRLLAHTYVHRPLIICMHDVVEITQSSVGARAQIVSVTDMDQVELSASEAALLSCFREGIPWSDGASASGFAASDLWFSTV